MVRQKITKKNRKTAKNLGIFEVSFLTPTLSGEICETLSIWVIYRKDFTRDLYRFLNRNRMIGRSTQIIILFVWEIYLQNIAISELIFFLSKNEFSVISRFRWIHVSNIRMLIKLFKINTKLPVSIHFIRIIVFCVNFLAVLNFLLIILQIC